DATKVSAATGVRLDALMELIGLTRSAAAYSTVTLKLTAIAATTVPAGTQYATAAEVIFATDTELVFTGAGQATVEATCTVTGPYNAGINEVTVIKTPIYGISACTNDAAAIPGRDRETD
ncbi:MAG: phage baseplate protein, partial [candidate division Zixibacteria bacterium]|nr:phage baseplate protein [candidate division Zixibacteria bacterium]